jgi:1-deoxy-D-xylulose-5-phosphate reductoisomerase
LKRLSILGSTGSIGKNAVEIAMRFPERFKVSGLAVMSNTDLLELQISTLKPDVVAVYDEAAADKLRKKKPPVEVLSGEAGVIEVAKLDAADMVLSAIVGSAGLMPTLSAIQAGKEIALANKEALVMAGEIIMAEASERGVKILPVDSEHSAIFQCLSGRKMDEVRRLILTASGGSFLNKKKEELDDVTPEEALNHPNWDMGRKITIDSATLMNKGLEVIEAFWLFGLPAEQIGVVIHPQSIIHSMVELVDGGIIAQMSVPDMKGAISYAISYPDRLDDIMPALNFAELGGLTFEEPDMDKYRSLALAFDALKAGGTMPAVLNTANEVAVEAFLGGRIPFTGISRLVSDTMDAHKVTGSSSIEEVLDASDWAKKKAAELIKN